MTSGAPSPQANNGGFRGPWVPSNREVGEGYRRMRWAGLGKGLGSLRPTAVAVGPLRPTAVNSRGLGWLRPLRPTKDGVGGLKMTAGPWVPLGLQPSTVESGQQWSPGVSQSPQASNGRWLTLAFLRPTVRALGLTWDPGSPRDYNSHNGVGVCGLGPGRPTGGDNGDWGVARSPQANNSREWVPRSPQVYNGRQRPVDPLRLWISGALVTGAVGANDAGEPLERADDLAASPRLEILHEQQLKAPHGCAPCLSRFLVRP